MKQATILLCMLVGLLFPAALSAQDEPVITFPGKG